MAPRWTSDLAVNIKSIDDQHQRLFQLLAELDGAMREGKGKDLVGKTIQGLADYTNTHFGLEEKLFQQYGYVGAAGHKAEHKKFVAKVAEFRKDFEAGKGGISVPMLTFLTEWLTQHIKVSDQKYAPLFKEKGVA